MKSNLKNQIDPKTNYKISYQKISMKHLEQIMFNQISKLILRRTSCWNNITNKYYWPKTGRSSQKQNMYEKQSQKPNWSKNKLQNFLLKDINETSWTDNVQPNIKLNIKTNWEIPTVTTWQINTINPKQADQVKNKTCMKSNLENQIDPKINYKISYQKISMKHLE